MWGLLDFFLYIDTVSLQPSEVGVSGIFLFFLVFFFCSVATLFGDQWK